MTMRRTPWETIQARRADADRLLLEVMAWEQARELERAARARRRRERERDERLQAADARVLRCPWCGTAHLPPSPQHPSHPCTRCPAIHPTGDYRCRKGAGHGRQHYAGGRRTWSTAC